MTKTNAHQKEKGPPQEAAGEAAVPGLPSIHLKAREDRRLRRGHLWVFSNEVERAPAAFPSGDAVNFYTHEKRYLGTGFYNPRSLIAGRLLDRRAAVLDAAFFENRLRLALDLRQRLYPDNAYRWVFGESDDLPGLVIDRYGDACVLESYCAGMDKLEPLILQALKTFHPWKAIVARYDASARRLEGLTDSVRVLEGAVDRPHWFALDGLRIAADLQEGQKTGFFFDQRENRARTASLAKGKTVLDLFCHTGGFGLWAARAGAARTLGIDDSEPALALAGDMARENNFQSLMGFEKADVFKWLESAKETFDIVVLDPPKLAGSKKNLPAAVNAYVRLNREALKRTAAGGFLATASCSQHLDREEFRQILSRAAYESGRRARIIHWTGQAPDHPVRPSMPETEYLKFAILSVN